MRVLVATSSTADDRKTIAAVRALGAAGCNVVVGADRRWPAPRFSRFCQGAVKYPDPAIDMHAFQVRLADILEYDQFDVFLPLCDYTTVAAIRQVHQLQGLTAVAVPGEHARELSQDKLEILRLAERLGIPVPATWPVDSGAGLERVASELDYPCVLKLRRGAAAVGLKFPASPEELLAGLDDRLPFSDAVFDGTALLVQEYVPGDTHDVCALFRDGEPKALLTQRRLKMYPPNGGIGIYNETTDDPEIKELASVLLRELRWHGPAQVEFRRDKGGTPKLIEVNPRFWGTLDLAIRAGINFPLLTCKLAADGDVDPVFEYRVGLKYRWPIPYGFRSVWRGPRRFGAMADFFLPRANVISDFRPLDPLPNAASWVLQARNSSNKWLPSLNLEPPN